MKLRDISDIIDDIRHWDGRNVNRLFRLFRELKIAGGNPLDEFKRGGYKDLRSRELLAPDLLVDPKYPLPVRTPFYNVSRPNQEIAAETQRHNHVGGSDIPMIVRPNPVTGGPADLFYKKKSAKSGITTAPTAKMLAGKAMEGTIIKMAAEELPHLNLIPLRGRFISTKNKIIAGNPDGVALSKESGEPEFGFEVKYANGPGEKLWREGPPLYVIDQAIYYGWILHLPWKIIALVGEDIKIYDVDWDDILIKGKQYADQAVNWHEEYFAKDICPPVTPHDRCLNDELAADAENERVVKLTDELILRLKEWERLREEKRKAAKAFQDKDNELKSSILGSAIIDEEGVVFEYRTYIRNAVDYRKLKWDYPEVHDACLSAKDCVKAWLRGQK
jgi:predicted phage-related endonuclease